MGIRITNLNKAYGEHQVLENFCAEIPEGKTTCVMAASGKGKTTLLRILMGLERADGGEIAGLKNKRISAVFQEDRLCENFSTEANIRLVQKGRKGRSKDFLQQLQDGLSAVGLEGCGQRPVKELSGGMKRRAALLRALYADWDILLLDEPFKGLDRETKDKVLVFVREKCRGKTVLCVTHEKEEAEILGAEILEL
ncbi:MAG TPA: ATP-binding cassette domain-containing protein [Candidatus Blautia stercoravium]|nr:ATP-binding cassette domain-containing protein [Candidatus Blautia stercoravium]